MRQGNAAFIREEEVNSLPMDAGVKEGLRYECRLGSSGHGDVEIQPILLLVMEDDLQEFAHFLPDFGFSRDVIWFDEGYSTTLN